LQTKRRRSHLNLPTKLEPS